MANSIRRILKLESATSTARAAKALATVLAAGVMLAMSNATLAQDATDPAYAALKGKKVTYIPIAMNYSLTQAWYAGMKREAERFGYEINVRDPNWDAANSVQAFQAALRDKPDLIVTLPTDTTSISRLVAKARDEKIPVIEIQQITSTAPDIYVGPDFREFGRANAEAVVKACGKDSGKSGKVAVTLGVVTAPASISWEQGIKSVFAGRSDITVVQTQAASWEASKSNAIATTALQQHPDLCAIMDMWDGQATGSASAVNQAGKTGKVFVATTGGGEKPSCDAIAAGGFSHYVSFNAEVQASYLNTLIKYVLQSKKPMSDQKSIVITPPKILTKETLSASSCWTLDELKRSGG
ncbi:MAG: sugar ABC transporter substrate-binding protein [Proteobacteria bacterium]|nr:sugar ABC transporter substrate-binding protein [Pseudomonadota bacterium]